LHRSKCNDLILKVESLISVAGYCCIEVDWVASDRAVRVFVDRVDGAAVNLPDCVAVNRILDDSSCFSELLPSSSRLEVSSPGVERPIRRIEDFEYFLGHSVKIRLAKALDGQKVWQGVLVSVKEGESVTVDAGGKVVEMEWSNLGSCNLVFNWND